MTKRSSANTENSRPGSQDSKVLRGAILHALQKNEGRLIKKLIKGRGLRGAKRTLFNHMPLSWPLIVAHPTLAIKEAVTFVIDIVYCLFIEPFQWRRRCFCAIVNLVNTFFFFETTLGGSNIDEIKVALRSEGIEADHLPDEDIEKVQKIIVNIVQDPEIAELWRRPEYQRLVEKKLRAWQENSLSDHGTALWQTTRK